MTVFPSLDDFRRHVLDGSAERVSTLDGVVGGEGAAQAEVGQDDVALLVQQDVLQLDVAIYHTVLQTIIFHSNNMFLCKAKHSTY